MSYCTNRMTKGRAEGSSSPIPRFPDSPVRLFFLRMPSLMVGLMPRFTRGVTRIARRRVSVRADHLRQPPQRSGSISAEVKRLSALAPAAAEADNPAARLSLGIEPL